MQNCTISYILPPKEQLHRNNTSVKKLFCCLIEDTVGCALLPQLQCYKGRNCLITEPGSSNHFNLQMLQLNIIHLKIIKTFLSS